MEHYLREVMTDAFRHEQRRTLAEHRADQDRTVEAVRQLNAALVAAASGRTPVWRRNVADALEVLHQAVTDEAAAHLAADSLLSDIARTQPRLRDHVPGTALSAAPRTARWWHALRRSLLVVMETRSELDV